MRPTPQKRSADADEAGSLRRAIRILSHLAEKPGPMSVRAMANVTGVPRSTLHRVVQSLVDLEVLQPSGNPGQYTWGRRLRAIAAAVNQSDEIRRYALPILREIVGQCDESAMLTVYDPNARAIVFVEHVQCNQPVRYHPLMNVPRHIHSGASGLSVMAFLPPLEIEAIIAQGLTAVTDATITDPAKLKRKLGKVRSLGYAFSRGERVAGAVGIACPVFDARGEVVGSVHVSVPETRYRPALKDKIVRHMLHGAAHLSRQLGYMPKRSSAARRISKHLQIREAVHGTGR